MNTLHASVSAPTQHAWGFRRHRTPFLPVFALVLLLAACGAPAGAPIDNVGSSPAAATGEAQVSAAASSGTPDAAAVPSASAAAADELVPLTLGGPVLAAPGLTPKPTSAFGYALERGEAEAILAKYGFTYSGFAPFNNGPPVAQALESGDITIGAIGDTPAVLSRAGGLDNRAIVIDRPVGDIWFLAKPGGVTSLADLQGKRVGLQFGSNFDKYGRNALTAAGIVDEVELINLLIADALPALQRGDIDAYALPAATAALWVSKSGFPVIEKASVARPDQLGTSVTLVNADFLAQYPAIQQAWWEATAAGITAIKQDPDAYLQFVADGTGQPLEIIKQATILDFANEPIDPAGLKAVTVTHDFLVKAGVAKQPFAIDAWTAQPEGAGKGAGDATR